MERPPANARLDNSPRIVIPRTPPVSSRPVVTGHSTNRRTVPRVSKVEPTAEHEMPLEPEESSPVPEETESEPIQAPRSRSSRWRVLGRATVLALASVVALWATKEVWRFAHSSPAFAIAQVEIEGSHEHLDEDALRHIAGIVLGQNVFSVSPSVARERLREHPWIRNAEVRRRLPGTFQIVVEEHVPVFVVAVEDSMFLVDTHGQVFKTIDSRDPVDFPVVTGVVRDRFVQDRAWRSMMLGKIAGLLADWSEAGLLRKEPIAQIRLLPSDEIDIFVGQDAMLVELGKSPYLAKFRKLRRVFERLERSQTRPLSIHLSNLRRSDRIVVRLPQVTAPLATAPVTAP